MELLVAEMHPRTLLGNRFRIIEKITTIDGLRDRITDRSFPTFGEAQEFIDKELKRG